MTRRTDKEWLQHWSQVAGIEPAACSAEALVGLFAACRQRSVDPATLFDHNEDFEDVASRMRRVLAVEFLDPDIRPFLIPKWSGVEGSSACELLRRHLHSLSIIVQDDAELANLLAALDVEWSAEPNSVKSLDPDYDPSVWLYDATSDHLLSTIDRTSPLRLLRPAALGIAGDLYLSAYVLWPLYEAAWTRAVTDPFVPFFEFWAQGLSMRFYSETRVCVFPTRAMLEKS